MEHFKFYTKQDILSLTKIRRFETKLGERLHFVNDPAKLNEFLRTTEAKFILFGVPEDIGTRANQGVGGTDTAWLSFLQFFLNIQSNDFLSGDDIALAGHFDFGDIQYLIDRTAQSEEEKLEAYRHAVTTIDNEVEKMTKVIYKRD